MKESLSIGWMAGEQNEAIARTVEEQRPRLRSFIRRRVADAGDAEDILQDVFYELVAAVRMAQRIEQVGAWLFRVARNRIIDRSRKKRPDLFGDVAVRSEEDDAPSFEDLLPSADAGPEAAYARGVLIGELEDALGELPDEQRAVFVAHEIEGRSFKELAEETGLSINTLLSRKRYAVMHLRERLRAIYDEFEGE
jgi:RNA polymerase sigma factor (sigma-70 family)